MKLFDFLTAAKQAGPVGLLSRAEVLDRLVALNRATAPFRIVDGREEGADLIAEWKIVDAGWHRVFSRAGLEKACRIYLKLDEARQEARALDREYELSWWAGTPRLSLAASAFRGQKSSIEFGRDYGFIELLDTGEVYSYYFNARELKRPIQETVAAAGWKYKGVTFGKF